MDSQVSFAQPNGYGPGGQALYEEAGGQHVIFSVWKEPQPFESERQGKPVFKDVEMVEFVSSDNLTVPKFKVTDFERRRFHSQYEAFKNQRAQAPDGTLMSFLYPGAPEIVEMLASLRIYTIEKLAALTDLELQQIPMGGFEFRAKAQKFMETAKDSARFHTIQRDLDAERFKTAEASALIDKLNARMRALEARAELDAGVHDDVVQKRPRGRPPKPRVEEDDEEAAA